MDDFDKFNTTFRMSAIIGGIVSLAMVGGVVWGVVQIVKAFAR